MIALFLWMFAWCQVTPVAVLARFAHEPSALQVQRWVVERAGVDATTLEALERSGKRRALLPMVGVRYRITDDAEKGYAYLPVDGVLDQRGEPFFDIPEDAERSRERQVVLQARWDLGDLLLSSEGLRAAGEIRDRVKLRRALLREANRIYFERRRAQVRMLLAPRPEAAGQLDDLLLIQELTADLDALTGGRFSAALHPGSPPRP